jgi:hypothetical protein
VEEEIKALIESTLHITVKTVFDSLKVPCATLELYLEDGALFGNGKCLKEKTYVQIDLYYQRKSNCIAAKNMLKAALIERFPYPEIEVYFDPTCKLYRADMKFVTLI